MSGFLTSTTGRRLVAVLGGGAVAVFVLAVSGTFPDAIQDGLANAVDNLGVDLPGGDNRLGAAGDDDADEGAVSFPDLEIESTPSASPTSTPSPQPYRRPAGSSRSYYHPYADEDDDFSYYDPYGYEEEDDGEVYIPPPDDSSDDSGAGYGQPGEGGEPGFPNGDNANAGTPGEGGPGGEPG